MFDWLVDFVQWIWDWLASGIYDFVVAAFVLLTKVALKLYYEMTVLAADVAYELLNEFIESLNLSEYIAQKYNSLDSKAVQFFAFFRIPEGLNLLFNAMGTRLIMRYIPFIGGK